MNRIKLALSCGKLPSKAKLMKLYSTFFYFEVGSKGKLGAAGNNVEESSAFSY